MNRRTLIKTLMAGSITATLDKRVVAQMMGHGMGRVWHPSSPRFDLPLKVPPTLEPIRSTKEQDEYEIVQRVAQQEILPGLTTNIWGYEGMYPGPTIRVRSGRTAVIHHTNQLSTHTVTHLHGGRTPSDSDGYPMDMVMPGDTRTYTYPNHQRAATLWYHDHAMDHTGENVYRGLAGFYIIEDDEELALPLPKGEFDIPLLLQDRMFDEDGSLLYMTNNHFGFTGDVMLVNGVPWPKLEVSARRYRFRILNGSNGRDFALALSSEVPFTLIGTDGGLLPAPVVVKSIPLSMAERVDVIVDFSQVPVGSKVLLLNTRERPSTQQLMRFDVVTSSTDDSSIPLRLSDPGFLEPPASANTRSWRLLQSISFQDKPPVVFTVNGKRFDPDRVDARVPLGEPEIWRFRNEIPFRPWGPIHPPHVHLAHFQILERNGKPPLPHETGWKDTVGLANGEEVKVLIRFEQFRGRYMMHCHNLEHEDHEMMSRFDVV